MCAAVNTGARHAELEGIDWADVDIDNGWIRLAGTKTADADRHIPVSKDLYKWLTLVPDDLRIGKVVHPWGSVRRDLAKACDHLKIKRATPNDLRRTFCSWLLQAGSPMLAVADLMGHSSLKMIKEVYGHLNDDSYKKAISGLPECVDFVQENGPTNDIFGDFGGYHALTPNVKNPEFLKDSGILAVPRDRIELPTRGFSVLCSTD